MPKVEAPKGLPNEVERTQRNFDVIKSWGNVLTGDPDVDVIILQAAAALEPHELDSFRTAYDLLTETEAAKYLLTRTKGLPGFPGHELPLDVNQPFQYKYPMTTGCLLAALEIVKKNRANSLEVLEQAPVVSAVQAEVQTGLGNQK